MTNSLVDRLRNEQVEQSSRCGEEDSQDRALLAEEAANEIERLRAALTISRGQWIHSVNAEQCMIALGCEAEWREIEARRSSEPLQQRCDCWERISALIVKGPLEGDGWDPTAQRNGIILAANHIAPFNRPASRDASPADLVGALQDVVHTDPGPVRAGKAFRSEPEVHLPPMPASGVLEAVIISGQRYEVNIPGAPQAASYKPERLGIKCAHCDATAECVMDLDGEFINPAGWENWLESGWRCPGHEKRTGAVE